MSDQAHIALLPCRAVVAVQGPDWRGFLQGLVTQDVETLAPGELRYGALLTPQGRLLFDLLILGRDEGCWLDCAAAGQGGLVERLRLYRLRAKVELTESGAPVAVAWGARPAETGWTADPRLAELGWRRYGASVDANASAGDYGAHALALGAPGPADWGADDTYPLEADFDLLNGIDFRKGCFVGQETTSRMKRRGRIKSRMLPIVFEGAAPAPGSELLAGSLRAGEALSGAAGRAMALVRLDRLDAGALTLGDGRPWRPDWPDWLKAGLAA